MNVDFDENFFLMKVVLMNLYLTEVKELEDDVALKEGRLLVVLERDWTEAVRISHDTWASLSLQC